MANTSDAVEGFFRVVDSFLESQRTRLLEVFRECDKNRDGKLEAAEVRRLLAKVMGGNQNAHRHTIEAQAALLTALLDVDGDSAVSYAELSSAFRGCEAALRWHGTAQARGAVRARAHGSSTRVYGATTVHLAAGSQHFAPLTPWERATHNTLCSPC